MEQNQLAKIAKKVRFGFANGRPNCKVMGFTRPEVMAIHRQKQKDEFEGLMPFYICDLCLDFLVQTLKKEDTDEKNLNEKKNLKEKILDFESKNSERVEEISKVANFDVMELIGMFKIYLENDFDRTIDENIFYCATIAVISKLGAARKFDKNIFYTLFELVNMY